MSKGGDVNSGLTSKDLPSQWDKHHWHQHPLVAILFFSYHLLSLLCYVSLLSKLLTIDSVLVLEFTGIVL